MSRISRAEMGSVSTPCVSKCDLDLELGLCRGCGRSRAEIARWLRYSEAERLAIMGRLAERLSRLNLS